MMASGTSDPGFEESTGGKPTAAPMIIDAWLGRENLKQALSPTEQTLMAKGPGEWSRKEMVDVSWRREALTVLEWGLELLDPIPPPDSWVPLEDLFDAVSFLRTPAHLLAGRSLRSNEELSEKRDAAEFWFWRCRTMQIQNFSEDEKKKYNIKTPKEELTRIVGRAAAAGEKQGLFRCIDGDFPSLGKPFRDLTPDEWSRVNSTCSQRLYGLNWLCNFTAPDWDNVETNT